MDEPLKGSFRKKSGIDKLLHSSFLFLLTIHALTITGCSNLDRRSDPAPPINPDGGGGGSENPFVTNTDRSDNVKRDLSKAVEKIRGRNTAFPQRGVFFSAGLRQIEKSAESSDTLTWDNSDVTNFSLGYDQRLSNSWITGSLLDYTQRSETSNDETSFQNSVNALSLFLFANRPFREHYEFSLYYGMGRVDNASSRITGERSAGASNQPLSQSQQAALDAATISSDSDSNVTSAGLSLDRRFEYSAGYQLTVRAHLDAFRVTTDGYAERGSTGAELSFEKNSKQYVLSTLSGGVGRAFSRSYGVLLPSVTVSFIAEFVNDDPINATIISSPEFRSEIEPAATDNTYGNVNLDLVLVRPAGLQLFANVNWNFGNDYEQYVAAHAGGRLEF